MMNRPLISVIVPIYNAEKYLVHCVDSVLKQTYHNIEVILLNDGSVDGSDEICRRFASEDSRIVYIRKDNSGVSHTRNVGLEKAKGDYVFFLDSDDYLDAECLEQLYFSAQFGQLAMTGYCLDLTNENRIDIPQQAYGEYADMVSFYADFSKYYATKFNFVWGKLYQTDIIRKHCLRFSREIFLGEDLLFNLNYYRYCKKGVIAISHNGYFYRQHGGFTLSKKFDPNMFSWNEVCYTAVRDFLVEFDCFTSINRTHLYRNVLGNFQYGFYLIALNRNLSLNIKVDYINKYLATPIYRDALSESGKRRWDYMCLHWLLHHGMIRTYVAMENIKNIICHGFD